jgi:D-psicose/D-tagatose/L-ribulose 3-epimerase
VIKFGVFSLVWGTPLAEMPALAARASAVGAEVLEIAISADPLPFAPREARTILSDAGLASTLVTSLNPERDLSSDDAQARANGREFLRRYIHYAAELSSPNLSGPLYGAVFQPTLMTADDKARKWAWVVDALQDLGTEAERSGVRLCVEPLSRFHTSFLNTAADTCRLLEDVGSPAVGALIDTFQMNIEEKHVADAIRRIGASGFHVHASENDRGTPGTGHVDWTGVRDALRETGYDGYVVIEAFNPALPGLAQMMRVWRPLEPDQDTLAREGLRFLKSLFA